MTGYYDGPQWATAILVAVIVAGAFAWLRWERQQRRGRARRDRQREYARQMGDSRDWYRELP